jgi:predicted GNAT family acetyltransferase
MTDPVEPTRDASDSPDDGTLSHDQTVLIDEVIGDPYVSTLDFLLTKDEKAGIYEAIVGDTAVAGLTYDIAGDGRLVLLATSVLPEFRKQGIATELIRRVLDDVRAQGKTATTLCPIVRTFIEHNPGYADLIESRASGVTKGRHRS